MSISHVTAIWNRAIRSRLAGALLLALAAVVVLTASARAAAAADDHDLWFVMEMNGKRAGWMRTTQKTEGDHITTSNRMQFALKRGKTPIAIRIDTEFVETLRGKPVSMKSVRELGTEPQTSSWTFGEQEMTAVYTSGKSAPVSTTEPLPEGVWLTPAAAGEFASKRLEAGAKSFEVRSIDPSLGAQPFLMTTTVLERTTVEALGKSVPALKVSQKVAGMPQMESVSYIDDRGLPIRSTTEVGGIQVVILAADKDLAMAELDPPEIMQRTLVKPDKPIADARKTASAVYLLRIDKGELSDLPATGSQRVERVDARSARVTVNALANLTPAPAADATDDAFLKPSSMLEAGDATVKDLAVKALNGGANTPADQAEAMRRFVHGYITKKDLGVGLASAAEVARTRQGDCSEHACLLAAMLRAGGIRSRVASGLIYVDSFLGERNVFGYHMWTQALLEVDGKPTWVDLDATLPRSTPYDATHIALSVSSMSDTAGVNPLVALAGMLGQLQVAVESAK